MPLKKSLSLESTFATYTADEIIGEGGAGIVYHATTDHSSNEVAIKVLSPDKSTAERRKRFKNELQFGMTARHGNVMPVLDHGLAKLPKGTTPFYVMPLCRRSLRQAINEGIPAGSALTHFAHIIDGVEAAHLKGVVHRDLKPENILFDPAKKSWRIADFGIAEFTADELYTTTARDPPGIHRSHQERIDRSKERVRRKTEAKRLERHRRARVRD